MLPCNISWGLDQGLAFLLPKIKWCGRIVNGGDNGTETAPFLPACLVTLKRNEIRLT